jgi:hypothetical protein
MNWTSAMNVIEKISSKIKISPGFPVYDMVVTWSGLDFKQDITKKQAIIKWQPPVFTPAWENIELRIVKADLERYDSNSDPMDFVIFPDMPWDSRGSLGFCHMFSINDCEFDLISSIEIIVVPDKLSYIVFDNASFNSTVHSLWKCIGKNDVMHYDLHHERINLSDARHMNRLAKIDFDAIDLDADEKKFIDTMHFATKSSESQLNVAMNKAMFATSRLRNAFLAELPYASMIQAKRTQCEQHEELRYEDF